VLNEKELIGANRLKLHIYTKYLLHLLDKKLSFWI